MDRKGLIMNDLINRQAAMDACNIELTEPITKEKLLVTVELANAIWRIKDLPSAQPDITDAQAIEHLQATGWMQNHDHEMYMMGRRDALGDDSGSYDALIPAEQKFGKWIVMDDDRISGRCSVCGWEAHMYEDDVVGMDYCPNCGAKMEEQNVEKGTAD